MYFKNVYIVSLTRKQSFLFFKKEFTTFVLSKALVIILKKGIPGAIKKNEKRFVIHSFKKIKNYEKITFLFNFCNINCVL